MDTSTVTIRIEGKTVTLIVDGREQVRECATQAKADSLYGFYKSLIGG